MSADWCLLREASRALSLIGHEGCELAISHTRRTRRSTTADNRSFNIASKIRRMMLPILVVKLRKQISMNVPHWTAAHLTVHPTARLALSLAEVPLFGQLSHSSTVAARFTPFLPSAGCPGLSLNHPGLLSAGPCLQDVRPCHGPPVVLLPAPPRPNVSLLPSPILRHSSLNIHFSLLSFLSLLLPIAIEPPFLFIPSQSLSLFPHSWRRRRRRLRRRCRCSHHSPLIEKRKAFNVAFSRETTLFAVQRGSGRLKQQLLILVFYCTIPFLYCCTAWPIHRYAATLRTQPINSQSKSVATGTEHEHPQQLHLRERRTGFAHRRLPALLDCPTLEDTVGTATWRKPSTNLLAEDKERLAVFAI
ncbi:hypothetical protein QBC46DRAFT_419236 [Diplogelasinospora grovesii]|uniref:Uncharacterized protein n=1 Tax=Diplogelasinospora grovesii TaxID=303347 RepID=A0AAN6MZM7_9PEZI|nr:hypothetical protein QBC46DRAFT_419236 [Diplogelasinospora grovesii]